MKKLVDLYKKRKLQYNDKLLKANRLDDLLVLTRLVVGLAAIGLIVYRYFFEFDYFWVPLAALICLFIVLLAFHRKVREQIRFLNNILEINHSSILRLEGNWSSFKNDGSRFVKPDHRFSSDLNIYGRGSLFQYLNASFSPIGETCLAEMLLEPGTLPSINQRQEAVRDLTDRLEWRQHFQATGMDYALSQKAADRLISWAESSPLLITKFYSKILWILPLATILFFVLWLRGIMPGYYCLGVLGVQVLVLLGNRRNISRGLNNAESNAAQLKRVSVLLSYIEQESFKSELLKNLQQKLFNGKTVSSRQIHTLARICDLVNLRYSQVFYIILNAIFLWDLLVLKLLEEWKLNSGLYLRSWFEVQAAFEALSSLAGLAHDNPNWIYPNIQGGPPLFQAKQLGHPLIHESIRVGNDVLLNKAGALLLITGSNMSGKSTLLRSVGVNLVLAYAGAPVCAGELQCSLLDIYTCLNVNDNLEEKTSTFYAELKRIKSLMEAANSGKKVMFLVDEVFRGTNSRDKIIGARAIIKKLITLQAIGFITTHDLELSVLQEEHQGFVRNYHFSEEIRDKQIIFDYKLKPGVSRTTNALALMQMIGIEV
ncbi:MAG: MutS family DNA mismatch repair protein [Chitinophagales bacterium]